MKVLHYKTILIIISLCFIISGCEKDFYSNPEQEINSEDFKETVSDALIENCGNHEEASDYIWNTSEVVTILLNENSATISGSGASASDGKVIISSAGTYNVSGIFDDGQILVNSTDDEVIRLILDGADISCSSSSPLYVQSANKAVIILAEGTENHISDGSGNSQTNDDPNAAIFSVSDLTFGGTGTLMVDGNYNDGISSKDGLIIKSGNYIVNAVDDGIRGKDYLIIKEGNFTINTEGDGLISDNEEDSDRGYLLVETGIFNITSGCDAFSASTDLLINDGEINIISGGGSNKSTGTYTSTKGLKGIVNTIIEKGTFLISSADDAIHSNGNISINGGIFNMSTGDDAIHADSVVGINGGEIIVTKSYEGIESAVIIISDGNIHINSSDDGINVATGNNGSDMPGGPGRFGQQNPYTSAGDYWFYLNGGNIYLETEGDGIDINGGVVMTAGNIIINGPTANNNGALDFQNSFSIGGGFLLGVGSSGMAQIPSSGSTQYSVLLNFKSSQSAGTLIHMQTSDGEEIFCFRPAKRYQSLVFSSPELVKGKEYDIYIGGTVSGTEVDGLYIDGAYTPGTKYTSFTVSNISTKIY